MPACTLTLVHTVLTSQKNLWFFLTDFLLLYTFMLAKSVIRIFLLHVKVSNWLYINIIYFNSQRRDDCTKMMTTLSWQLQKKRSTSVYCHLSPAPRRYGNTLLTFAFIHFFNDSVYVVVYCHSLLKDNVKEYTGPSPAKLLEPLFKQSSCSYRVSFSFQFRYITAETYWFFITGILLGILNMKNTPCISPPNQKTKHDVLITWVHN